MHKILVIEDDCDLGEVLHDALAAQGFDTTLARSGTAALNVMSEREFDLVTLDLHLQDMDGFFLLEHTRQKRDLPVLVCSGEAGNWQIEALERGAHVSLHKPFPLDRLLHFVHQSLGIRRERLGNFSSDYPSALHLLDSDRLKALPELSPEELDALDFGVVAVDSEGTIRRWNRFEAAASGLEASWVLDRQGIDKVFSPDTVSALYHAVEQSERENLPVFRPLVMRRWDAWSRVSTCAFSMEKEPRTWILLSLVPLPPSFFGFRLRL